VTAPDPGRVLRRALVAWGLGHLAVGRTALGRWLLVAEAAAIGLVAWLTAGLADSSAYLLPFIGGMAFLAAWAWQAIDAYRIAHALQPARPPTPERSPAAAIGWLSIPLLIWGSGFWVIGAGASSPAAVLDRFMTAWTRDELGDRWPPEVVEAARAAATDRSTGPDRLRNVRISLVARGARDATAVAEAIHYERRASRFLGIFTGSELVPVPEETLLTLELIADPVELPGGGDIGALRWELASAAD
jgi:hypothetical protein